MPSSVAPTRKRFHDWVFDRKLSKTQRLIGACIDRLTKQGHEFWATNARIAELVGCSERSVQKALKRFTELGLIRVIRNAANKTGRAIQLLWRSCQAWVQTMFPFVQGGAKKSRAERKTEPEIEVPPHTPPMCVSEDLEKRTTTEPDSSSSFLQSPEGEKLLEQVVESVKPIFKGNAKIARTEVRRFAQKCDLLHIEQAAVQAIAKGCGFGYVVNTLKNWEGTGPTGRALHEIMNRVFDRIDAERAAQEAPA
jgi:Helix-turn-helix domain